jgi:hypothetical protein
VCVVARAEAIRALNERLVKSDVDRVQRAGRRGDCCLVRVWGLWAISECLSQDAERVFVEHCLGVVLVSVAYPPLEHGEVGCPPIPSIVGLMEPSRSPPVAHHLKVAVHRDERVEWRRTTGCASGVVAVRPSWC